MTVYNSIKDLLDGYRAGPDVYRALLQGCTQEQATAARGGDEDWSVVEVMCHLRDAEERALERMRAIRDEESPHLAAYDQDEWARERAYASQDLREVLDAFIRFREAHVADLEKLAPAEWERTGNHAEQGRITISDQTLHMLSHDAIHASQIARQLGLA
jgi:hypothetical protein